MKRTKHPIRIPDAINCSITKDFTQIPNSIIRNPEISSKASRILSILLSNKEGSHEGKILRQKLREYMKEGETVIENGLIELEQTGYLKRFRIKDKKAHRWASSCWLITTTPWEFIYPAELDQIQHNFVYIIQNEHAYKIGVTTNLLYRFSQLQKQSPFPIKIILIKQDEQAYVLESILHSHFKHLHLKDEWFALTPADLKHLETEWKFKKPITCNVTKLIYPATSTNN